MSPFPCETLEKKHLENGLVIPLSEAAVTIPAEATFNKLSVDSNGAILGYPRDPFNMVCNSRGSGSIDSIVARKKVKAVSVVHDEGLSLKEVDTSKCSFQRSVRIHDRKSKILGVQNFIS
ncbi:hypothetical protein Dimus_019690 [Dionaea muscipula]